MLEWQVSSHQPNVYFRPPFFRVKSTTPTKILPDFSSCCSDLRGHSREFSHKHFPDNSDQACCAANTVKACSNEKVQSKVIDQLWVKITSGSTWRAVGQLVISGGMVDKRDAVCCGIHPQIPSCSQSNKHRRQTVSSPFQRGWLPCICPKIISSLCFVCRHFHSESDS